MKYKIAIIGSRGLQVDIGKYVPPEYCERVISGGAVGIDSCAREFANKYNIPLTEHLPQYNIYGKKAPLVRNRLIVGRYSGGLLGRKKPRNHVYRRLCKKDGQACETL